MTFGNRFILLALALLTYQTASARSGGPDNGYAGNPPNRQTCVACHNTFQLNSGRGSLEIRNVPARYQFGQTYRLTVALSDPNAQRWGFELTSIRANNQRGGTLAITDRNTTQLSDPGGVNAAYLKHSANGTFQRQANGATWNFDWTAPNQDQGTITFYVAGNAANNDGGDGNDRIYATSVGTEPLVNHAPVIHQPSEQTRIAVRVEEESVLRVAFSADDADRDRLTWSILNRRTLPDSAIFTDAGDGTAALVWTPQRGMAGEYSPTFRVVDAGNALDTIQVVVTVTALPPRTFPIALAVGWNLISAPVPPAERNAVNLWRPVRDRGRLIMIKDQGGRFYAAGPNFSNLPAWDFRQGYLVRVSEADTLVIEGNTVAEDTPIPLNNGWNFVAYFPEEQIAARDAFRGLGEDLVMVKDSGGRFYNRSINFSNMQPLRRGQGYMVRVSRNTELVWNQGNRTAANDLIGESLPVHFGSPSQTGANMCLLIQSSTPLPDGSELAVRTLSGVTVGAVALDDEGPWGVAIWSDDPTTPQLDGAVEGEALQAVLWNGKAEQVVGLSMVGSELRFSTDSFAEARLSATTPVSISLLQSHPNPFNGVTTVSFAIERMGNVRLAAFDLSGRLVAELFQGESSAGHRTVAWDASKLQSGVYILKLESERGSTSMKVALVK